MGEYDEYILSKDATTDKKPLFSTFLDKVISFVGVGVTMYAIVNLYTFFTQDTLIQQKTKCGYCRKEISGKVHINFLLCYSRSAF